MINNFTDDKELLKKLGGITFNEVSHTGVLENYNSYGINLINLPSLRSGKPMRTGNDEVWIREINPQAIYSGQFHFEIDKKEFTFQGEVIRAEIGNKTELKKAGITLFFLPKLNPAEAMEAFNVDQFPVAVLEKNTLSLFFNLSSYNPANCVIAGWLIKQAIKLLKGRPLIITPEIRLEQLFNIYKQVFNDSRNVLMAEINEMELVNRELTEFLTRNTREYVAKKELVVVKFNDKNLENSVKAGLAETLAHKKVKDISVSGGKLFITVKDLTLRYAGLKFELPEYVAVVGLTGGDLKITYPDNPELTDLHPHARSNNTCAGNFTSLLPRIVATGQLSQVADFVIEYLSNYNPESPLINIRHWYFTALNWENYPDNGDEVEKVESYFNRFESGQQIDPAEMIGGHIKLDERFTK